MSTSAQHGYLVIADISGYTSFVAKTELEHSHEILTELLELLVNKFQPLMTISKLEGDAVFAFANDGVFARGETLIDFIESMYVAFRDKQLSMKRATCRPYKSKSSVFMSNTPSLRGGSVSVGDNSTSARATQRATVRPVLWMVRTARA